MNHLGNAVRIIVGCWVSGLGVTVGLCTGATV